MYKIKKEQRDEIIRWLRSQIVPSEVGAGMIQVSKMLENLEEIKEEVKENA